MTVVRTDINFLMRLLKTRLNSEKILEALEQIGTDPELLDNELVVEIYPNRPDMYSPEGIARALRAYLEISPGLPRFNVRNGDLKIIVKKSVLNIRPYIAGAVVRDVSLDEEALESIMRLQEALHDSYGRKRRRVAIGIHDLDKVTPPFTYRGISPDGVRFVPLGFDVEMTPREILEKHPKGVEYGHIIKDKDAYPLIIDRRGNVLSMP
ncbi:MAG TPA: phenylalanine--tRNA ligase subunit beta, partial [Euryarchaeota archaeon]|nr:phenylalanine--tRNA ligase subunit beta [Euryarchaeota archaeon]